MTKWNSFNVYSGSNKIFLLTTNFFLFQLNDAYEEVDEQRQVVAQWKRKTQKLQGEMHDQKLLLEEQVKHFVHLSNKLKKFLKITDINQVLKLVWQSKIITF